MLWDSGTWAPIKGKSARDIDDGHLHFILDGQRMKGEWMLIRLKPRGKEKGENWLLCKVGDDFVGGSDDLVEQAVTSVTTGRTMDDISRGLKPALKRSAAKVGIPRFRPPQLAALVDSPPTGNAWVHEVKYFRFRRI
jgi:bifunctional non-homologous end joining protein LigD